jgi:hypothetical protein
VKDLVEETVEEQLRQREEYNRHQPTPFGFSNTPSEEGSSRSGGWWGDSPTFGGGGFPNRQEFRQPERRNWNGWGDPSATEQPGFTEASPEDRRRQSMMNPWNDFMGFGIMGPGMMGPGMMGPGMTGPQNDFMGFGTMGPGPFSPMHPSRRPEEAPKKGWESSDLSGVEKPRKPWEALSENYDETALLNATRRKRRKG